jgi:23S rRNA pseudouridine955/2504/2580 synthase
VQQPFVKAAVPVYTAAMVQLHVAADDADRRLDRILRNGFPNVPPGAIAGAIRRGEVRLNGHKVKGEVRVREGDLIEAPDWTATGREERRPRTRPPARREDPRAPGGARSDPRGEATFSPHLLDGAIRSAHWEIPVIGRSDDWLALNKPPGLPVHGKEALDEMVRVVAADEGWWKESLSFRPGPVHRLDAGTTGVQLFSLSTEGARVLTEELRHRRVTKMYLAFTAGYLPRATEIDRRLAYDRTKRLAIVEGAGRAAKGLRFSSARTVIYPVAATGDEGLSLVAAFPRTGRTHQVRAHLASEGLPLVGDTAYGGPSWTDAVSRDARLSERKRMMLHALVLAFENPAVLWNAPLLTGDFHMIRTIFGDTSGLIQRLREILAIACTTCGRETTIDL